MSAIPVLEINPDVVAAAEVYILRHVMPAYPSADRLHLALASHYRRDFLLTWNCQHLANANKFRHIRVVNNLLGLFVPVLTTPFELLTWVDDDEE